MKKLKNSNTDFVESSLPKNRRQQFFDIVKHNYNTLFNIGSLLLLFSLPLLICILLEDINSFQIRNDSNMYLNNKLTNEAIGLLNSNSLFFGALKAVSYIFIFLCLGGIFKILRKLSWGEHVIFKRDFSSGFKQNLVNSILFGIFFALLRFITTYCIIFVTNKVLFALILGACLALFVPLILIGMVYTSFYEGGFIKTLYHSTMIYIKKLPFILVMLPVFIVVPFLYLIESFILKTGIIAILIIVLFPFLILAWYEILVYVLDKTINENYYKDLSYKGLYKENE